MGFMPIATLCPHLQNTEMSSSFHKSSTRVIVGIIWILTMATTTLFHIWLISTSTGFEKVKFLCEALNSFNATIVLFFSFRDVDLLVLELNGLSSIVSSHKVLAASSMKHLRRISYVLLFCMCTLFVVLIANKVTGEYEMDTGNTINFISVVGAGLSLITVFGMTWIKMLVMIEMFETLNRGIKHKLLTHMKRDASLLLFKATRTVLESEVKKTAILQMALVRNYKECNRFWSPAMLIAQMLSVANLVIASYIMVISFTMPSVDKTFIFQMQVRTHSYWVGIVLGYSTQQRLGNAVSSITNILSV